MKSVKDNLSVAIIFVALCVSACTSSAQAQVIRRIKSERSVICTDTIKKTRFTMTYNISLVGARVSGTGLFVAANTPPAGWNLQFWDAFYGSANGFYTARASATINTGSSVENVGFQIIAGVRDPNTGVFNSSLTKIALGGIDSLGNLGPGASEFICTGKTLLLEN